ncbi:MAG: hypothetical protein BWY72_01515 [Bacteroidetes bacterium ADurb.Bin416]|nr:MAG: hypothetical protein BWY72_01515 [Bacteroidetes bacterium ADurb.Bin416]
MTGWQGLKVEIADNTVNAGIFSQGEFTGFVFFHPIKNGFNDEGIG